MEVGALISTPQTTRTLYPFGGQTVAQAGTIGSVRTISYLHSDHLGSISLATGTDGVRVSGQDFDPWGAGRAGGVAETKRNYTGQHKDDTGLLYYHARYYDPSLARFISADSIVPGSAQGSSGMGTIGMDAQAATRGLTVDFHEPGFAAGLNAENAFTQERGFWFQLSDHDRGKAKTPWGPGNPQALNRYSYVLENPLRYTDPAGHAVCLDPSECGGEGDGGGGGAGDGSGGGGEGGVVESGPPAEPGAAPESGPDFGSPAEEEPAANGEGTIGSYGTKAEARDAVDNMGLSEVQRAAVRRTLSRATSTSRITISRVGNTVIVRIIRPGSDGYQVIETTIGANGVKQVVQYAYDSNGSLVHIDDKTP